MSTTKDVAEFDARVVRVEGSLRYGESNLLISADGLTGSHIEFTAPFSAAANLHVGDQLVVTITRTGADT